jgi:hypothetical protein
MYAIVAKYQNKIKTIKNRSGRKASTGNATISVGAMIKIRDITIHFTFVKKCFLKRRTIFSSLSASENLTFCG